MTDIRGLYRHFKGGTYEVFGVCHWQKTNQDFVLYKPLYNDTGLWIRLYSMFFSKVAIDGKLEDRFAFMEKTAGVIDEYKFRALHSETYDHIDIAQEPQGNFIIIMQKEI